MIQRETVVNVQLSAKEVEGEIWDMDSTEQAQLLLYMARRLASHNHSNVVFQMQAISDDIKDMFDDTDKAKVKALISKMNEYFGEGYE